MLPILLMSFQTISESQTSWSEIARVLMERCSAVKWSNCSIRTVSNKSFSHLAVVIKSNRFNILVLVFSLGLKKLSDWLPKCLRCERLCLLKVFFKNSIKAFYYVEGKKNQNKRSKRRHSNSEKVHLKKNTQKQPDNLETRMLTEWAALLSCRHQVKLSSR